MPEIVQQWRGKPFGPRKPVCNQGAKYRILVTRLRERRGLCRRFDHATVRTDALERGFIGWLERPVHRDESGFVTAGCGDQGRNV